MTMDGAPTNLSLRDIHPSPPPSWWPPAHGWWLLAAVILLAVMFLFATHWRRRRRRRALLKLFDDSVAAAPTPAARIAAMSELLRRAARRIDPSADTLTGEAWLRFLDRGTKEPVFRSRGGTLLLEGAFRRDVPQADVEALRRIARERFLAWMAR